MYLSYIRGTCQCLHTVILPIVIGDVNLDHLVKVVITGDVNLDHLVKTVNLLSRIA